MAYTDRNTLKSWLVRGAKPLASQFASWIDAFWHKDDKIPASAVDGLQNALNAKADSEQLTAEAQTRAEADTNLQQSITDEATAREGLSSQVAAILLNATMDGNTLKKLYDLIASKASTGYVDQKIADLIAAAPAAFDTLKELADALGNDANFSTTVINALAGKANLADLLEKVALQTKSGDGALTLDFSKHYQRVNVTGGTDSISGSTFTNMPVTLATELNSYNRELVILNNRSTVLAVVPRTADLVVGSVTYSFVNMASASISVPASKRVELNYKMAFTSQTTCEVSLMYQIQS
jgi:hypothetical protein